MRMNRYLWIVAFALIMPFVVFWNESLIIKLRFAFLLVFIGIPGILLGNVLFRGAKDRSMFLGIGLWVLLASFLLWFIGITTGDYRIGYVLLAIVIGALVYANRWRFKD